VASRSIADRCAFATAPDVLSDAKATWERSAPTFDAIRAAGYKAALVAQNGIEDMSIEWDAFDAIFIGGDTAWKLSRHAQTVCAEAKRRGKWVHMGRVNSQKRLELAWDFGCDSVDGNYLGLWTRHEHPEVAALAGPRTAEALELSMRRPDGRELEKALDYADKQVEGSFALSLAREVRFLTAENKALKDLLRNPDQPEAPNVMKDDGQFGLPAAKPETKENWP
jgi:hypothetical protein